MTSRRSSGSMRADSAVEPTKSENITVTWRRSARSSGGALRAAQSEGRSSSLMGTGPQGVRGYGWLRWSVQHGDRRSFRSGPRMPKVLRGWGQMPRYIFAIRAGDDDAPERAAELKDDAAALVYACEIVRELMQASPTLIAVRW